MKRTLIALLSLLPLAALAQDDDKSERLRAAEIRLEQAAQEIAELSSDMAGESFKHVFKTMHGPGHEGRAMLGINVGRIQIAHDDGTMEESGSDPAGVVIHGVTPGGPADEAGLTSGDVILTFNGTPLGGGELPPDKRLMSMMDNVVPGETVTLGYRRNDAENTAQVVTRQFEMRKFAFGGPDGGFKFDFDGEAPEVMAEMMGHFPGFAHLSKHRAWRGLELVPLTPKLGSYFGTDHGLLVVRVPEDEAISLEEGDVIMTIAGATPDSPPEAMHMLRFYKPGDVVEMEIRRQKRNRTLQVTIPQ